MSLPSRMPVRTLRVSRVYRVLAPSFPSMLTQRTRLLADQPQDLIEVQWTNMDATELSDLSTFYAAQKGGAGDFTFSFPGQPAGATYQIVQGSYTVTEDGPGTKSATMSFTKVPI